MRYLIVPLLLVACSGETVTSQAPTPVSKPSGLLALPLDEPSRYYQTVGVDHDPVDNDASLTGSATCTDYDGRGFPWCYGGHRGSDYLLTDGWDAMDAGSTGVVAAADGVVVDVEDGNYDRCHLNVSTGGVDCDGNEQRANYVLIDHGDGIVTGYYHLMNGSIIVEVDQPVRCGEMLARVGSSGNSSFPHLHLAVEYRGQETDPYEGSNHPIDSLWLEQNANTQLPSADCP